MRQKRFSPLKSIRRFCLECAGTSSEVENCTANPETIEKAKKAGDETEYTGCPLYDYRSGHSPKSSKRGKTGKGNIEALIRFRKTLAIKQGKGS